MRVTVGVEPDERSAYCNDERGRNVPGKMENAKPKSSREEKLREQILEVPPAGTAATKQHEQVKRISKHRLTLAEQR